MKESGVVRSFVVVTLLLVLAEFYLQARNYAWLSDFFDEDSAILRSGRMPYDVAVVRVVWLVAMALLVVTVSLVGGRRWIAALALVAFASSLWLTPGRMILPGQDPATWHLAMGDPDTRYQVALALIALAAIALGAVLLLPRKSA